MHQSLPGIVIRNLRYIGRSFARGLQNTVPMPCKRSSQMTSFFSTQTIPIFTDKHHPEILRISTNGIISRSYTTRSFLLASAPIPPPSPNADTNSSGTLSTSTITHDSSSSDGGRSSGNRSTSDSGKYIFSALVSSHGSEQGYFYTRHSFCSRNRPSDRQYVQDHNRDYLYLSICHRFVLYPYFIIIDTSNVYPWMLAIVPLHMES
jgi:hypothetical protein